MTKNLHPIPPILELKKLSKTFGGIHAVDGVSFTIAPNSITGLIGPNGAGKTTTFDLISGLIPSSSGEIFFNGENITRLPTHHRTKTNGGLARTFQMVRLFPELTVLDNLLVILQHRHQHISNIFTSMLHPSLEKKELHDIRTRAYELLAEVNLDTHGSAYAKNLSYGQQKLLEITRCIATGADLFLLDEPAAGVNPTMLKTIEKLIRTLHAQGKTILIVEHNMPFVMGLCEKIIVMDQGKELMEGTPHEVQHNPKVLEAYLGKRHPDLSV